MEYGNTPLGQLAVMGGVVVVLAVFATLIRLVWRRGKGINR